MFHCRGHEFHPCCGNKIPQAVQSSQNQQISDIEQKFISATGKKEREPEVVVGGGYNFK